MESSEGIYSKWWLLYLKPILNIGLLVAVYSNLILATTSSYDGGYRNFQFYILN